MRTGRAAQLLRSTASSYGLAARTSPAALSMRFFASVASPACRPLLRPPPLELSSSSRHRPASTLSTWKLMMKVATLRQKQKETPDDLAVNRELHSVLLEEGIRNETLVNEVVSSYEGQSGLFAAAPKADNPFLRDQLGFNVYLRALAFTTGDAADKVTAACTRRYAIMSGEPLPASPATPASPPPAAASVTEGSTGLTREQLAEAALSGSYGEGMKVTVPGTNAATIESASGASSGSSSSGSGSSGGAQYAGAAAGAGAGSGAGAGTSYTGSASGASKVEPIKVIVSQEKDHIVWRVLKPVLSALLWTFVILTVVSFMLDQGPGGIMRAAAGAGPNEFKPSPGSEPVTFDSVHGCEEAKAELQEVVEFLKDPAKFSKLGGKLTRGVLLTGPPGTGKTLLARAVAGEAGVSFFIASGSDFDEMFVGVGAKRVRELFQAARKGAPAIIFIDELDAVGGKRTPRDIQHVKQTLNQLLVEMDGFSQSDGIIVIAATNLPDSLDKALVRPGRFDRHVAVPLPDVRGRMAILKHHARNVSYDPVKVDMSVIARATPGYSGAELEALVNQAAVRASLQGHESVTLRDFEWAQERIMMGSERKSAVVTAESRLRTAWHEAGHALAAIYTNGADPLHKITVVPRGHSLGMTVQLPAMDRDSMSFAELKAKIDVCMGGRAAEELIYGHENVTSGAASDIQSATAIANAMVRRFGFSEAIGAVSMPEEESERQSTQSRALIESEVRGLIEAAQTRTMAMLKARRHELERLANALVTYETLNGQEVAQIIAGKEIERDPL